MKHSAEYWDSETALNTKHLFKQESSNNPATRPKPGRARRSRAQYRALFTEVREKGTSILIETKDQRKEEREKREKQENWRERDITKARSKNTFVAARRIRRGGGFLFFWFSLVFSGFLRVFFWCSSIVE